MQRSFLAPLALAAALAVTGGRGAAAHAFLDRASPAVGSTVHAAPKEVLIWFTEAVEPAFSSIAVADAAGRRVDSGKTTTDAANAAELRIAVAPLPPGTYTVTWHAVSVDTHRTEGNFTFTVAPG